MGFDCVPEENSFLLGFGDLQIEFPAIDLIFLHPRELLGEHIYSRFGAEFPIRFDFLDTMGGGNISLQVHPRTEYIRKQFGMDYTQDESYYLLDAGEDRSVYLGLKKGIDREAMAGEVRLAHDGGPPFCCTNLREQVSCQEARSLPNSSWNDSLFGKKQHGARNQRDSVYLHVQALGLVAARPQWLAAADSS